MRNCVFLLLLVTSLSGLSQETLYKNYKITNFIDFAVDATSTYNFEEVQQDETLKIKVKFLMKEECLSYANLSPAGQAKIDDRLNLVRNDYQKSVVLKDCDDNIYVIDKSNVDEKDLIALLGLKESIRAKTFADSETNHTSYKAGLLFEDNRLYVNLWPFKNSEDQAQRGIKTTVIKSDGKSKEEDIIEEDLDLNEDLDSQKVLFYEIPDDHTARFKFTEYNLTAITIPLKYRFRTDRNAIDATDEDNPQEIIVESEEFSTSVNLAFFGGYTWGRTKFTHRKKVGNRTSTNKNTLGVFVGSSAVELKGTNTNITLDQPLGDREGTFGTISFGIGYVKSWNKVSVGLFGGIDKGVGRVAEAWVYDGTPWLGIGVGYDLFKL